MSNLIQYNVSLKKLNTFGFEVQAQQFVTLENREQFEALLPLNGNQVLILGSGSNICFTHDFEGLVIQNSIKGKQVVFEDEDWVYVRLGAGENWHESVLWAIEQGYGGIENLSLIPGLVGAAPIQNIGAYGVELKDVFVSLEAWELSTGNIEYFDHELCRFDYRDSIFKQEAKGKYLIAEVTLRLSKRNHVLHTEYGAIREKLGEMGVTQPSIHDISQAVIQIRQSKLPDPVQIGNAGSFFKNPIITKEHFLELQSKYPKFPYFDQSDGRVKIPAGWLIEQCQWKGKRVGHVGCHKDQALVLVNYGGGDGSEIKSLSESIRLDVQQTFGIDLTPEVNIL
jgi:UDP-N-acetylmuramate dehydrogenase